MARERTIARYRRWYARLVRLYPKAYRERFGEGMEQTFNDLCRERAQAGQGLALFALWMFVETLMGAIREMRHLTPFFAAVLTIGISLVYAGAVLTHLIDKKTFIGLLPVWLMLIATLGSFTNKVCKKERWPSEQTRAP